MAKVYHVISYKELSPDSLSYYSVDSLPIEIVALSVMWFLLKVSFSPKRPESQNLSLIGSRTVATFMIFSDINPGQYRNGRRCLVHVNDYHQRSAAYRRRMMSFLVGLLSVTPFVPMSTARTMLSGLGRRCDNPSQPNDSRRYILPHDGVLQCFFSYRFFQFSIGAITSSLSVVEGTLQNKNEPKLRKKQTVASTRAYGVLKQPKDAFPTTLCNIQSCKCLHLPEDVPSWHEMYLEITI
ncbi:hypothetical protein EVAR_9261_1 [Eumeta japonica]|uniref:Uncharacterized protein n=1 Tax=Eumeta variegata TaxID=151549 RepID=A0A4C1TNS4_EUMVA|nr:hypothetical protein EVAR_9261_1 [Eumeta japonica]